jgi:hypothetical protein
MLVAYASSRLALGLSCSGRGWAIAGSVTSGPGRDDRMIAATRGIWVRSKAATGPQATLTQPMSLVNTYR